MKKENKTSIAESMKQVCDALSYKEKVAFFKNNIKGEHYLQPETVKNYSVILFKDESGIDLIVDKSKKIAVVSVLTNKEYALAACWASVQSKSIMESLFS